MSEQAWPLLRNLQAAVDADHAARDAKREAAGSMISVENGTIEVVEEPIGSEDWYVCVTPECDAIVRFYSISLARPAGQRFRLTIPLSHPEAVRESKKVRIDRY